MTEPSVSFAGNLTEDPEVRYTEGASPRARFRVAVSGRREQEPSFFTVIVWRDQAEHATQSLAKSSRVVVVGRPPHLPHLPRGPLMVGCDVSTTPPARQAPATAGGPAPPRAGLDRPDHVLRFVCAEHRRQLLAIHGAGLADRIRWARDGLAIGIPPTAR